MRTSIAEQMERMYGPDSGLIAEEGTSDGTKRLQVKSATADRSRQPRIGGGKRERQPVHEGLCIELRGTKSGLDTVAVSPALPGFAAVTNTVDPQ